MKLTKLVKRVPYVPHHDDYAWIRRMLNRHGYDMEIHDIQDVYKKICFEWKQIRWRSDSRLWCILLFRGLFRGMP